MPFSLCLFSSVSLHSSKPSLSSLLSHYYPSHLFFFFRSVSHSVTKHRKSMMAGQRDLGWTLRENTLIYPCMTHLGPSECWLPHLSWVHSDTSTPPTWRSRVPSRPANWSLGSPTASPQVSGVQEMPFLWWKESQGSSSVRDKEDHCVTNADTSRVCSDAGPVEPEGRRWRQWDTSPHLCFLLISFCLICFTFNAYANCGPTCPFKSRRSCLIPHPTLSHTGSESSNPFKAFCYWQLPVVLTPVFVSSAPWQSNSLNTCLWSTSMLEAPSYMLDR